MPDRASQAGVVKRLAEAVGFDLCGIATAAPIPRGRYLRDWLARGSAGTMTYLHRHVESREDVRAWLPWARSIVVCGLNYRQPTLAAVADETRGRVAMYAWGEDYHVVVREKLDDLSARIGAALGQPFLARACVDTSAIVEREIAAAAGIGWIGKNTMVIHPSLGSMFVLGELITDLDLSPDLPEPDHCGTCTRCLEACPTGAFPRPYEMDAARCISYLTIEHRGEIDPALGSHVGDWVFGCDVCQDVCPYNQREAAGVDPRLRPATLDAARPSLRALAEMSDDDIRAMNRGRATGRAKPFMWRRNAKIASGDQVPTPTSDMG